MKKLTNSSARSPGTQSHLHLNLIFIWTSQHMKHTSKEKKNGKKNVPAKVARQRQLALTGGNVPDFDGSVVATASDKFAVRRKSHGVGDPVIETSQHMKHTGREEDHQKKLTRLSARSASTGNLQIASPKS